MKALANATINVGVIGAGWWATSAHIPAIKSHAGAKLIAVQRPELHLAKKIAQDFEVPAAFANVDGLLSMEELDAVIVSTTPHVHYAHTRAALLAGKHVLCEKPFTLNAAQAKELVTLATERDLQLLISCPWHYTRHGLEARRIVRSGELGEIKMISVLMTNPIDRLLKGINTSPTHGMDHVYIEPMPGSYNNPAIAGGGQIYCQVSHVAAYLSFLTGDMPGEISARFDFDGSPNDIYNVLTVRMRAGTLVSIASTGATPLSHRHYEVRIYGSKGIVLLELWKGTMTHVTDDGRETVYPPLTNDEIYPHMAPARNLIDTVIDPKKNGSPGELGLASMEVLEAACRSASASGMCVNVEELHA